MKVVKSRAFKDRLKGHKESILALYSPYGQAGFLLYSASKDGSFRAWDLAKRQIATKLLLSRNPDQTVRYEPGNFGDQPREATKQQRKNEQDKELLSEQLCAATFSEHSMFGAYEDGAILQWNIKTGDIKNIYKGHTQRVTDLQFIPSGRLASGSTDGTIHIWNITKGESEVMYKVGGPVNQIRMADKQLCALVNRNIFYQINIDNNSVMKCIKFSNLSITSFIYTDDTLIMGTIENKIEAYNLSKFDPTNTTVYV